MVDENLLKIMLAHASYSFAEIDWDFEQLTTREKSLVMNQENLDRTDEDINDNESDCSSETLRRRYVFAKNGGNVYTHNFRGHFIGY